MRKFYRTIIEVEVLSEDAPPDFETLQEVYHAITEGDCSGDWKVKKQEEVDGKKMAKLLKKQGSEPSFFFLNEDGTEVLNYNLPDYNYPPDYLT